MKCELARKVWANTDGPIAGLRVELPGVMERLECLANLFVNGGDDPFDRQVKQIIGKNESFFVIHADDNDSLAEDVHSVVGDAAMSIVISNHFSQLYGRAMVFGNVCCSGCVVQDTTLTDDWMIAMQKAAIQIG